MYGAAAGDAKFKIQNANDMCYDSGVKCGPSHAPLWRIVLCLPFAFCILHDQLSAQQLLDRVLARVDTNPITLTDVQAALALGIVQVDSGDPIAEGTQRMIDRQLELTEVQRFPPPEPPPEAVMREAMRLTMNVGTKLPALMRSTGLSEQRIVDIARDNLRIAGYLDQRFGTIVQVSDDEVVAYYRTHEAEFTKGGDLRLLSHDFQAWADGLLDDLPHDPALLFADRSGLGDHHDIADLAAIVLVVRLELGGAADSAPVESVLAT